MVALEVDRDEEFAPLKNASGSSCSCPETCAKAIIDLHTRYLAKAKNLKENPPRVELSALLTYDGEGLENVRIPAHSGQAVYIRSPLDDPYE